MKFKKSNTFTPPVSKLTSNICFLFLSFLMGINFSYAQEQEPREDNRYITVRFSSWERAENALFTTRDGTNFEPIHAPSYQLGRPSQIRVARNIQLFRQVRINGELSYEVAFETALPREAHEVRIYLARNGDHLRAMVMADDPQHFKVRDLRIINFSRYTAAIKVGEETFTLPPFEWRQMPSSPDHKFRVILGAALNIDNAWTGLSLQVLSIRPEYRGDVTIVHTGNNAFGLQGETNQTARLLVIPETEYIPPSIAGNK